MHDTHIVNNMMAMIEEKLSHLGPNIRVLKIMVVVGTAANTTSEHLSATFKQMAQEKPYAAAQLVFKSIPLSARCVACSAVFEAKDSKSACPSCGSGDLDILSGKETYIGSIEVE